MSEYLAEDGFSLPDDVTLLKIADEEAQAAGRHRRRSSVTVTPYGSLEAMEHGPLAKEPVTGSLHVL